INIGNREYRTEQPRIEPATVNHESSSGWSIHINSSSYLHHKNKISKNISRRLSPSSFIYEVKKFTS
ncbi:MAG: hypothetical protein WBH12_02135, partial [Sediminibacterium sp.]